MGVYSALLVQRRLRAATWETFCPTLRIPVITQLVVETALPGGWQSASFVIPAQRSRVAAEQYGSRAQPNVVWIMDGLSTVFYGLITKATPLANGDVQCQADGAYKLLAETRMRSVWGDTDLTTWTPAPNNSSAGQVSVDGNGDLTLSLPQGAAPSNTADLYPAGTHAAADYFLFGEAVGTRDNKHLNGWDVTIGGGGLAASQNVEVRIYGLASPGDGSPDLLQTFQSNGSRLETSDGTHGGENSAAWPSSTGYRCFRIGLWVAAAINHIGTDVNVKISKMNVSTRATTLNIDHAPSTTDIVRDVWTQAGTGYDLDDYLQEDNTATTGGMIVGNIADSTQVADGIAYSDWSTPQEIVEMMASLDGYKVGMYEPTRNIPSSAFVSAGNTTLNYWPRQPPELRYEAWADLGEPDYHIRLSRGAKWEPSTEPDQLESAVYVNYTNRRGRAQSVYVEDANTENRMWEQGRHGAVDWQIDPAVGQATAQTLANQYLKGLRQPSLSGTLTLFGDRPGSIEHPGGARVGKLSRVKPGVIRIVDAKGAKSGRVTAMTYSAAAPGQPETLVLTVNSPASARLDRNLARLSHRADVSRTR